MNRDLSSNFWWLRSANHVKFTEESVICTEKHVLVRTMYKWAKLGFDNMRLNRKDSTWRGNTLTL